jgi:hypothetical protein
MTIAYRNAAVPKKDGAKPTWSDPKNVKQASDNVVLRQRKHIGKGYRMREVQKNEEWGPELDLSQMKSRLPGRLDSLRVGETWATKALSDDFTVWTRKVEVDPPVVNTPGTDAIDKIYSWLNGNFKGRWENWGICVCKRISGSSSYSQHAYCNAIDLGGSTANLDAIAKAAVAAAKKGTIPCDQVIWKGWEHIHGGSVYDHYDHVHLTGAPQKSGYPTAC